MSGFDLNQEQRKAAQTLEGRLLISAGAGSGKTRVLTERAANAVAGLPDRGWAGIGIGELLAITFTEKAAGELSERVRAALRAAGRKEDARRVDAAWISTIHGMCSRILKAGALEAGIDPGFKVLETVESGALRQQAFEEAAVEALREDAQAGHLFARYGFDRVFGCVSRLADDLRVAGFQAADLAVADDRPVEPLLEEAVRFFAEKAHALEAEQAEAAELHCASCSSTAGSLRSLRGAELLREDLAQALWQTLKDHRSHRKFAGIKLHVGEIKDNRTRLAQLTAGVITAGPAAALLRLTDAFLDRYDELKRAQGGLDFDDLQLEAVRYLTEMDSTEWAGRFKLTMVDEFQDTDALQLELVERLSDNNLCTVGDERQSIYGFRGADIEVYRRHREEMLERDALDITLKTNYRSHRRILDFVNRVFDTPEMFQGDLVVLEHGRQDPEPPLLEEGAPRVELLFAPKADGREALTGAIARRFARLKSDGVPAGDMVVLIRSYTHAQQYADALRARGLDAIVVGGSRFFDRPEIGAMRGFVRLIANGLDEEALGLVLCSGLCALSDDGLLAMRRAVDDGEAESLWGALCTARLDDADRTRALRLSASVSSARLRLGRLPLAEILLRAVEETGLDARLMASGLQGREGYANLLKLARLAASFEESGRSGPAAFAAYLEEKERFNEHETPASLVRDGSDAVRIMSIHASKGLEFPVVAVPELGEHGRSDAGFARWDLRGAPRIALSMPGATRDKEFRTPPTFNDLMEQAGIREQEDTKRLLYVAFTRAKDVLILSGGASLSSSSKSMTPLRMVFRALGVTPEAGLDFIVEDDGEALCRVLDVSAEEAYEQRATDSAPGPTEEEQLGWLSLIGSVAEERTPPPPAIPRRFSYSGLKAFERCPRRYHIERRLHIGTRLRHGAGATDFGSAFHAVAELFGEEAPIDLKRLEAIGRHHGLDRTAIERLTRVIEAYRTSPTAGLVREFEHVRREAAFAIQVGDPATGFVLDGSIDVYAHDGQRALIVDYKTGSERLSPEEARAEYELQARCYALAAARDGRTAVDVVFVRPEADGDAVAFRFGPRDFDETEERLLRLHARIASGEASAVGSVDSDRCFGCAAAAACTP